jgi:hypothetical protein
MCNVQHATCNVHRSGATTSSAVECRLRARVVQRASCNVQRATCNVQRATCNVQRATCNVQRATCNVQRETCCVQRAMCNVQRATCNVQRATFNVQRASRISPPQKKIKCSQHGNSRQAKLTSIIRMHTFIRPHGFDILLADTTACVADVHEVE